MLQKLVSVLSIWVIVVNIYSLHAAEVVLVDKGRSQCTIVTGKDDGLEMIMTRPYGLTKTVRSNIFTNATHDLAHHLKEMGKIVNPRWEVRVVPNIQEAKTKYRILLGTAAIEKYNLQKEAAALSYVGYRYKTIGADLVIFGSSSKGTTNGIYGFLQNECGVRWFGPAPEDIFTVIPEKERVVIGTLDKQLEPSFYGRPGTPLREEAGKEWAWRMRRGGSLMPFKNATHHLLRMFPIKEYFDKHPEYYYMRGGKRRYYKTSHVWSVCYSNRDVIEIAAHKALQYFRASKYNHSFSVGINDCSAYCECPKCVKLQPKRTYRGGRVASDMYYHFVNEVAKRTAKEFPDRYIGAIAYNDVTEAPLGKMEKNVFVVLTNDISEYFDIKYRKREEQLIKAWEKKDIKLGLYYYMFIAKLVPASFPRHLAAQLKERYKRGFRVLFQENSYWPGGPMSYVDARLWWDVNLDVDMLIDEYFTGLYGQAAKPMKDLYELFEKIHMRPRKGGFLYEHYKFLQFRPYTEKDLEKMKALIQAAHKSIQGMGIGYSGRERKEERRLAYTTKNLRVFMEMLEGTVLARYLEQNNAKLDNIEIMRQLEMIEKVNAIINRHERVFRENLILDPYQSRRYRYDTCTPVRHQWKNVLSIAVGNALVKMYMATNKKKEAGKIDSRTLKRMKSEIKNFTSSKKRNALFNFRTGKLKSGKNEIINPDFEIKETTKVFPDPALSSKLDWRGSNAYGWAWWQGMKNIGSFGSSKKNVRSGSYSGLLKGTGKSACAITVVENVREGEVYHARAFVKNTVHTTREDKPTVSLRLAWLNKKNHWTQQGKVSTVHTNKLDEWTELETIVQIPTGVATVVLQIMAEPLYGDEEVFFDDVSFRMLCEGESI